VWAGKRRGRCPLDGEAVERYRRKRCVARRRRRLPARATVGGVSSRGVAENPSMM